MTKLRILLADDHQTIREGLKSILNAEPDMEVVGEVEDGQAAVETAAGTQPDVVILDLSMPKLNGLKTTEAIRKASPSVKILILTRHAEHAYLQPSFHAGASGYVLKQSRASELPHAVRAVATGGTYIDPTIAAKMIEPFQRRTSAHAPIGSAISQREEEVLRLVAWGYANKEIATTLNLSVKTVETHKAKAMQKLGLTSRIELVKFALLQGWLNDA